MPSTAHAYFTPTDLTMVDRALARVCSLKFVAAGSQEAERLAAGLIREFQNGVQDEDRLVAAFAGAEAPAARPD